MSGWPNTDWSVAAAVPLGFLVGYAVGHGSTCAVTAGKQLVYEGRARLLAGFVLAGGVAGLICLPLAWTIGMRAGLPPEAPIAAALVMGALLLATGALVNDACLFGTLSRIAGGEVRFLAVPLGLAFGDAALAWFDPDLAGIAPNSFGRPGPAAVGLVVAATAMVIGAWWLLGRGGDRGGNGRWPLRRAMLALGVAGALLFVLTPGWTYSDAVEHVARPLASGEPVGRLATWAAAAAIATLAGAVAAGFAARQFHYQRPEPLPLLRSVAGGALMAGGAAFVPGGNDSLLLWSVPGGSLSGLIAYVIMTAAILAFLLIRKRLSARPARR